MQIGDKRTSSFYRDHPDGKEPPLLFFLGDIKEKFPHYDSV